MKLRSILPSRETSSSFQGSDLDTHMEPSILEVAGASFVDSSRQTELNSLFRAVQLKDSEKDDDILEAGELNKRFPKLEVPFSQPTSLSKANQIAKRSADRRITDKVIQRGTESGAAKVVSFVSGALPQIIDPVGFAIGSAIGFGLPKVLGQVVKNAAFKTGILSKPSLGKNIAEGVAGNLVSEFAIVNPISRQEQADVDSQQSFINAVVGGAGLPLAANALRKTFSYLLPKRAEETFGRAQQVVESQIQNGKKPQLDDFVEADRALKLGEEVPNRAQAAEKFDQPESDLYYDELDVESFQRNAIEIESADRLPDLDNELNDRLSEVQEFESQGNLSQKELDEISSIRELGNTEQTDVILKAATACLRGTI